MAMSNTTTVITNTYTCDCCYKTETFHRTARQSYPLDWIAFDGEIRRQFAYVSGWQDTPLLISTTKDFPITFCCLDCFFTFIKEKNEQRILERTLGEE